MNELLFAVGCVMAGATLGVLVMACLMAGARADERIVAALKAEEQEATDHIRRFSAAMAVLDMDAYRARKANGSSAGHAASEPSHSVAGSAKPRAESLITGEATING